MMTKLPRPGGYHRLSDLIPVLTLSQRPDVRSWKSAKGAIPRPTTTTPTITNGSRVSTSASSLLATETEVMGAIGHDGQLADNRIFREIHVAHRFVGFVKDLSGTLRRWFQC